MSDSTRKAAAVGIVALAVLTSLPGGAPPAPQPDGPLSLAGAFSGPSAAADAGIVAALSREIADEIECDGASQTPYMKAGVHFDTLRTRARDLRCRGRQLGEIHPEARDRIARYLDTAVGNSGGPVDAAARAAWVKAYRVIGDAADAAR